MSMKKESNNPKRGDNDNMKSIDLNKTVQKLCTEYPELIEIMRELGFTDIVKPGMLATAGRFMTIPKGASTKKIDMDIIRQTLKRHGFEIMSEEGAK